MRAASRECVASARQRPNCYYYRLSFVRRARVSRCLMIGAAAAAVLLS